jgi:polysaccharide export outer membrane protein
VRSTSATTAELPAIKLVDIDDTVVRSLVDREQHDSFAASFGTQAPFVPVIGLGDTLEVVVWEAPPATLFLPASLDAHVSNAAGAVILPQQLVGRGGAIQVPFAGRIEVLGKSTTDVADEIARQLRHKANQPQVIVRVAQNGSAAVSVVGEVVTNIRVPLNSGGERLLDALAAAGGSRQPVGKTTLQLTRGNDMRLMSLDDVVRDPAQNIVLRPGDVLTVLSQPYSFTVLGASGKQQETPLETQGISLAQALGRAGGLLDSRADPNGIFVFRMEPADPAAGGASAPMDATVGHTLSGLRPVVYRLDLRDPKSFFAMRDFPIRNRDILYISNAPSTDLQKFLNLVFSVNRQVVYTFNTSP